MGVTVAEQLAMLKKMETNIFLDETAYEEFARIICGHFLPDDYMVVDPISTKQVLTLQLIDILDENPHPGKDWLDILIDNIENAFKRALGKRISMPSERKHLFRAVLNYQGLNVEYVQDRSVLRHLYDANRRSFVIETPGKELLIVVPVYFYAPNDMREVQNMLTDERYIRVAYIYDSEEVTGTNVAKLIAMIESNRWKRR
jgi:hypothetical protein